MNMFDSHIKMLVVVKVRACVFGCELAKLVMVMEIFLIISIVDLLKLLGKRNASNTGIRRWDNISFIVLWNGLSCKGS